ncbi:hypothetical protein GCM10010156_55280 [Planobispora rosea]|uniref:Uncharacterized protein n=1 Tax=Planobispora rosea TaxID=35762 RepID=A0A8J3WE93_PLARO|nr:hypothetical protein GCM10010156_55280 [Planobispora rosea]GIH86734.1 hypothetical protein Pro02_51420 [Planobispora rosea]
MSALPARQGIHLVPPTLRKKFEPVGGVSISVPTGEWVAVYEGEITDPVVAFDNAGNALVLRPEWGALVRANAWNGFLRVDRVESPSPSAAKGAAA